MSYSNSKIYSSGKSFTPSKALSSNNVYGGNDPDAIDYIRRREATTGTAMPLNLKQAWNNFFSQGRNEGWLTNVLELWPTMGTDVNQMVDKPIWAKKYAGNPKLTNNGFTNANIDSTYKCLRGVSPKSISTNISNQQIGVNHGYFFYLPSDYMIAGSGGLTVGNFFGSSTAGAATTVNFYYQSVGIDNYMYFNDCNVTMSISSYENVNNGLFLHQSNPSGRQIWRNGTKYQTSASVAVSANLSPDNLSLFKRNTVYGTEPIAISGMTDGLMSDANIPKFTKAIKLLMIAYNIASDVNNAQEVILIAGQSNAIGGGNNAIINSTIGGGLVNYGGIETGGASLMETGLAVGVNKIWQTKQMQEETKETGWTTFLQGLNLLRPSNYIMGNMAVPSTAYVGLKKGTNAFANGIYYAKAYDWSIHPRKTVVRFIPCIHGEADGGSVTYQSNIRQWQADYQADLNAALGTSNIIPMFHSQINGCNAATSLGGLNSFTNLSSILMYKEAKLNPYLTKLVMPKYCVDHNNVDGVHLTGIGHMQTAEYYLHAIYQDIYLGIPWKPLWPEVVNRVGSTINITFNVPSGVLAFDTTIVSDPGNYGFEFYPGTGGNSPTITGVTITGINTVQITLSATPTGSGCEVRYAYTATNVGLIPGGGGTTYGAGPNNGGARGNLRNTIPAPSNFGYTNYHWCVQFSESV